VVTWEELEGLGVFTEKGVWYKEPIFTVNDLVRILNTSPSRIRYWIQRGWLIAEGTKRGYQIPFLYLYTFFMNHGDKLRGLPSTNVYELIPKEYHPSPLPEARQHALKEKKRAKWRRKRYREYKAWVQKTYEARKRILLEQDPSKRFAPNVYANAAS
jgi:hypothetical protein